MTDAPFQPTIKKHGQPYVHEAQYAYPKSLTSAVLAAIGVVPPGPVVVGYEKVQLNWVKPR